VLKPDELGERFPLTEKSIEQHAPDKPGVYALWRKSQLICYESDSKSLRQALLDALYDFLSRSRHSDEFQFEVTTAARCEKRRAELIATYYEAMRRLPPANDIRNP